MIIKMDSVNTVSLFTIIPASIRKDWTPASVSVEGNQRLITELPGHYHSLVRQVSVIVKFDDNACTPEYNISESSPGTFNHLQGWKESQTLWMEIEKAVEEVIIRAANRSAEQAKGRTAASYDALFSRNTQSKMPAREYDNLRNRKTNIEKRGQHLGHSRIHDYDDASVTTVRPKDSVSVASKQSRSESTRLPEKSLRFMDYVRT